MDIKELKFVRLTRAENARLIPKYLIEQTKGRDFTTKQFFRMVPFIIESPENIMGVFVNEDNIAKGFMWAMINVLTEQLYLGLITIDKEYQNNNGESLEYVLKTLRAVPEMAKKFITDNNIKLKDTIIQATTRPKVYEKRGWHKAEATIMEISIKEK